MFGNPRPPFSGGLVAPQFGQGPRGHPRLGGHRGFPGGPKRRGGPPFPPGFLVPNGGEMASGPGMQIEVHQLGGAPPPELLQALSGGLGGLGGGLMGGLGGGLGGVIEVSEPIELNSIDLGMPGVRVMAGGAAPPGLRGSPREPGREIPADAFMQAFSGLMNPLMVPLRAGPQGRGGPRPMHPLDQFVNEVLGGLGVQVGMMEVPGLPVGPPGCRNETKKLCRNNATHLFHCLATHAAELSKGCEETFRKSLPEVCKATLEKKCDPFEEGILPCLQRQTDLEGDCKDSLQATVQSITSVKDGIEKGATVVHKDGDAETARPLVAPPGNEESYYDQFKTFAEKVIQGKSSLFFEDAEA